MADVVLGLDVGGTKALLVATGAAMSEPLARRVPTGADADPAYLERVMLDFVAEHSLRVSVVGVAVPGLVERGKVVVSDVLPRLAGWGGPVIEGASCVLANDIRCALAAQGGEHPTAAGLLVVMCGTAVGSAYLVNGELMRGASGFSGEVGSVPLVLGGVDGSVRRLDDVAGGSAIVRTLGMDPSRIQAELANGNGEVRGVVDRAGELFGLGLATLVNVLNPNVVRVGGGTLAYDGYWDSALRTIMEYALPELAEGCDIERIPGSRPIVAEGAARIAEGVTVGHAWARQYV